MRWFKPNLRSSFFALFTAGPASAPPESVPAVTVDDIRDAMLALIADREDRRSAHVGRRVRGALDPIGLWYLRADLLALLAGSQGEARAREKLQAITAMFEHLLPQGLKTRPSPLSAPSRSDDASVLPD